MVEEAAPCVGNEPTVNIPYFILIIIPNSGNILNFSL